MAHPLGISKVVYSEERPIVDDEKEHPKPNHWIATQREPGIAYGKKERRLSTWCFHLW